MEWTQYAVHYPLAFIVLISVLVFVHEFGHFWVARRCGVKVETFSIGFGPEIFGWNDKHGTRWRFALFPLGGYVKMFGDADPASTPDKDAIVQMTDEEKKSAFFYKPVGQRAAIVFAGPLANYIFAWVVMAIIFMTVGQPFTKPVVDNLIENMPAAAAGIQIGDEIISVDNNKIQRFEELQQFVRLRPGQDVTFEIKRGEKNITLPVTLARDNLTDRFGNEHPIGMLGIRSQGLEYQKHDLLTAIYQSVKETYEISANTLMAMGQVIMGQRSTSELGGPLRIAQMSGDMATQGLVPWIMLMVLISINLGLINLFPIPILDGGHLVFYAAEALRGKPVPMAVQDVSYRAGLVMIMALMVFTFWNDLVQLRVISYLVNLVS
jgi:regulator of sigma E protease